MTASTESRRRRYVRQAPERTCSLTPVKRSLLRWIGEFKIASLPQLARLIGASEKATRRHCRALFDSKLVNVIPVARFALADAPSAADPTLLYGSAPNIYALTKQGAKLVRQLELVADPAVASDFGPGSTLFLAHELGIRDVRVSFELAATLYADHQLMTWRDGEAAKIELSGTGQPSEVRPDARFIYQLGPKVLLGLVEYDRGTERGDRRWKSKIAAYRTLFTGNRLKEGIGYNNARLLVVTSTRGRRDVLASLLAEHADVAIQGRCWIADRADLMQPDLSAEVWRQPGSPIRRPLIPGQFLQPVEGRCL